MKKLIRIVILIFSIIFFTHFNTNAGKPDNQSFPVKSLPAPDYQVSWTDRDWRAFDVNADKQFDKKDIEELLNGGWRTFKYDLNGDGAKDVIDILTLYLKLSVLDRNCNEAVTDDDFAPVNPVSLPSPDKEAVNKIVDETVKRTKASLPASVEEKLFNSLHVSRTLTLAEKAYVFQTAGMSALLQKNLEAAQWAFGRACQTNNQSASSLGSLAFTLAMDKKHEDAFALLAFALQLFPRSGATLTTIAWIYARHNQKDEAVKYYRLAAMYAPGVSQYNMNLGISLIRSGKTSEAHNEFKSASKKDPGNFKAVVYSYVTDLYFKSGGIPSSELNGFKKDYDEYWSKMKKAEPTEDYSDVNPWEDLSKCEQTNRILEYLSNRYTERFSQAKRALEKSLADTMKKIMEPYLPLWKDANEDYRLYCEGLPVIYERENELKAELEKEAGNIHADLCHEHGLKLLGYSKFFLEGALEQAEADAPQRLKKALPPVKNIPIPSKVLSEIKSEIYKTSSEEAYRDCYESPISRAINLLQFEGKPVTLSGYKSEVQGFALIPMEIVSRCMGVPGYCKDKTKGYVPKEIPVDFTIGFDFWIISFEWNTSTGEVELNVGQGLIVGATWSPQAGFGIQIGVGIDKDFGPVQAEFVVYAKFSENKIEVEGEAGFSIGLGLEYEGEMHAFQAVAQEP